LAAPAAAFMAPKAGGRTGSASESEAARTGATAQDGEGRRFCFAVESGRQAAPENRWPQPLPDRAACRPVAL